MQQVNQHAPSTIQPPVQQLGAANAQTKQQDDRIIQQLVHQGGALPQAANQSGYMEKQDDRIMKQLVQQGGSLPQVANRDGYNKEQQDDKALKNLISQPGNVRQNMQYPAPFNEAGIARRDDQILSQLTGAGGLARQDDFAFDPLSQTGDAFHNAVQQQDDDDALKGLLFGAPGVGAEFTRRSMADSLGQPMGTMTSAQWQVDSFGQQMLSDQLRKFDGEMGKVIDASMQFRKASAPASGVLRRHAAGSANRITVELRKKKDILRISRCINANDLTLQRDVVVDEENTRVMLPRGLRILRVGPLKGCKLVRAALERVEPWATLVFERPGISGGDSIPLPVLETDIAQRGPDVTKLCAWRCPACGGHYPV